MVRDSILHIQPPVEGDYELIVAFHDPRHPPQVMRIVVKNLAEVVAIVVDAIEGYKPMLVLIETVGIGLDLVKSLIREHKVNVIPVDSRHINRN